MAKISINTNDGFHSQKLGMIASAVLDRVDESLYYSDRKNGFDDDIWFGG